MTAVTYASYLLQVNIFFFKFFLFFLFFLFLFFLVNIDSSNLSQLPPPTTYSLFTPADLCAPGWVFKINPKKSGRNFILLKNEWKKFRILVQPTEESWARSLCPWEKLIFNGNPKIQEEIKKGQEEIQKKSRKKSKINLKSKEIQNKSEIQRNPK